MISTHSSGFQFVLDFPLAFICSLARQYLSLLLFLLIFFILPLLFPNQISIYSSYASNPESFHAQPLNPKNV